MKIYVSVGQKHRDDAQTFLDAVNRLKEQGHKVIDVYKDEAFPQPDSVEYHVKKFKETEKAVREADILIVDSTFPGRRQGYEIARGIDERKVVLALYDEEAGTQFTPALLGNPSKNLIYKGYSADTIDKILKDSIDEAKSKMDTKFILIISPEIDKYLEWAANERRMHKAQVVRNAIEDTIAKDKEYQQFLKELDS